MSKINRNGVIEDMTPEEETQLEQDNADYLVRKEQVEADKTALDNLKASAKAKLVAGEALTEEEANTIVL
jgi:aconitase B